MVHNIIRVYLGNNDVREYVIAIVPNAKLLIFVMMCNANKMNFQDSYLLSF